jgi:hypothetical protein
MVQLPARVVILDAALFTQDFSFCSRLSAGDVDSFFDPSRSLILEIDTRLPEVSPSKANAGKMHSEYARQYIGLYRDGKQYVYVNGFHQLYFSMLVESEVTPGARAALRERMQVFALQNAVQAPLGRDYWRVRPFNVCDGRLAFWGVEFAVETRSFGDLNFNK